MAKDGVYSMTPFIEYDPTRKKGGSKEFYSGILKVSATGAIVNIPFKYSMYKSRSFSVQTGLIPTESVVATETIRTSNLTLPIAKGAKIVLCDNKEMTVYVAEKDIDEKKGQFSGDPYTAWIITLK